MDADFVINFGREAVMMTLILSLPMLGLGLFVGLVISIFQAVTSIQEMTLTFIPKIIAILGGLIVFSPWLLDKIITYTQRVIINIPDCIR